MILVDSDVLISHLRGKDLAKVWLADARTRLGKLSISVISVAEIVGGMRAPEKGSVYRLLSTFVVLPVTEEIARRAGELRRQFRASHSSIVLPDYLVAATALVGKLEMATLNVGHFPMFPDLAPPFVLPAGMH